MGQNQFLAFATGGNANVTDQASWAIDPTLTNGFYAGIAPSAKVNKAIRQGSFVGASISEWVNQQLLDIDINDDGVVQEWVDNFNAALIKLIQSMARRRLSAPLTLYVSTSGSDTSGDGLTQQTALATPQRAWNMIMEELDTGGQAVTVQLADGTYPGFNCSGAPVGQVGWQVTFTGDPLNIVGVVINGLNMAAVGCSIGGVVFIENMRLQSGGTGAGAGCGIYSTTGGLLAFQNIDFDTCSQCHIMAADGEVSAQGDAYSISGPAPIHCASNFAGSLDLAGCTVTINSIPTFSVAYIQVSWCGVANLSGSTFVGQANGARYQVSLNGVLSVGGQNPNTWLPGNANGTSSTGGQVA
jgi:hypothetical protein